MKPTFVAPSEEAIRKLLDSIHHIAVIGLSPKPKRPSYKVASALQQFGYHIIPVRPAINEVLGETAYASLEEVPGQIDLVDVFRAAEFVSDIVDECIRLKIPALWLQDGVIDDAAAARAQAAGIFVVMDRCIYRDLNQFKI